MPTVTFSYFAVDGEDGRPRVCAVVDGCNPPPGAVEITEEEAHVIEAQVAANEPPPAAVPVSDAAAPSAAIDVSALIARISAIEATQAEHSENFRRIKEG